jgi:hypothetical protein
VFSLVSSAVLGLQVASCVTILCPERRGQTGGRVAVMDGFWCLLIPTGIIAFIGGAIYAPGGRR